MDYPFKPIFDRTRKKFGKFKVYQKKENGPYYMQHSQTGALKKITSARVRPSDFMLSGIELFYVELSTEDLLHACPKKGKSVFGATPEGVFLAGHKVGGEGFVSPPKPIIVNAKKLRALLMTLGCASVTLGFAKGHPRLKWATGELILWGEPVESLSA